MKRLLSFLLPLLATGGWAAALPGFRIETLAPVSGGFASSIVSDSRGVLYYTTTSGGIYRLDASGPVKVASVSTFAFGDAGLLGMALRDDHTAIVHYTTPQLNADVISSVDLGTGAETVIHTFYCDLQVPTRPVSTEHHGGNPIVAPDGSIFVGIGDYGGGFIASVPEWNGGKIWHILPDGSVDQFALGFRNPFDLWWDDAKQRLIVPDNGDITDDEINIVHHGDNCGWPFTMGNEAPIAGDVPPVYTFPTIVAPTGFLALDGRNATLQRGFLLGTYTAKALLYIANIDAPDPIAVIDHLTPSIIDVTQTPDGQIYFATGMTIYRLVVPQRGDCNGDGLVNADDLDALLAELADGAGEPVTSAQNGSYPGSWGCDVNGDGVIDANDVTALKLLVNFHLRAVRH